MEISSRMVDVFYGSTQLFLILCGISAVAAGILYRKRFREMRFIVYYTAASTIQTIVCPILVVESPKLKAAGVADMSSNVFLIIEFLVIYNYYLQILKAPKIKIRLYIVSVVYVLVTAFCWFYKKTFSNNPEMLFVPQSICILYPTFCYFFEMLKTPSRVQLIFEPSFWVTTGIMLYFGCTLPLFLLNGFIDFSKSFERGIFSINFLCYGLLFILIIKAYLCKKREVQ